MEQNIVFPVLLDYQKPNQKYLEELLEVLKLRECRHHLPSQLSGGQQQRVAIGRALITRPALILADEPTGNLDTQNSSEVIALLKEASRKYEQTIVMITHSRGIAQTADRILEVSDGVLTDFGRYDARGYGVYGAEESDTGGQENQGDGDFIIEPDSAEKMEG